MRRIVIPETRQVIDLGFPFWRSEMRTVIHRASRVTPCPSRSTPRFSAAGRSSDRVGTTPSPSRRKPQGSPRRTRARLLAFHRRSSSTESARAHAPRWAARSRSARRWRSSPTRARTSAGVRVGCWAIHRSTACWTIPPAPPRLRRVVLLTRTSHARRSSGPSFVRILVEVAGEDARQGAPARQRVLDLASDLREDAPRRECVVKDDLRALLGL